MPTASKLRNARTAPNSGAFARTRAPIRPSSSPSVIATSREYLGSGRAASTRPASRQTATPSPSSAAPRDSERESWWLTSAIAARSRPGRVAMMLTTGTDSPEPVSDIASWRRTSNPASRKAAAMYSRARRLASLPVGLEPNAVPSMRMCLPARSGENPVAARFRHAVPVTITTRQMAPARRKLESDRGVEPDDGMRRFYGTTGLGDHAILRSCDRAEYDEVSEGVRR